MTATFHDWVIDLLQQWTSGNHDLRWLILLGTIGTVGQGSQAPVNWRSAPRFVNVDDALSLQKKALPEAYPRLSMVERNIWQAHLGFANRMEGQLAYHAEPATALLIAVLQATRHMVMEEAEARRKQMPSQEPPAGSRVRLALRRQDHEPWVEGTACGEGLFKLVHVQTPPFRAPAGAWQLSDGEAE